MKNIKPIRNAADLEWAIGEIAAYFDAPPEKNTPEADRFDVLADLIEAYENRSFAASQPEPVEFLKAFMELTGRDQADLAVVFKSRSRASEVLNRKRALTVDMIFKLKEAWAIPADCLITPYDLAVA